MTNEQKAALLKLRDALNEKLVGIRCDAEVIKNGDVVDDYACDSVAWGARGIALAFNGVAPLLGLEPIEVPEELEKSPNQEEN